MRPAFGVGRHCPGSDPRTLALLPLVALVLACSLCARSQERADGRSASKDKSSREQSPPAQPIPFSHKKHASTAGIGCDFCHHNPEPGNDMSIPTAGECMTCHSEVAVDKEAIRQLARFAKSNQPIPWVRVYSVPAFVFWSHRTHAEAKIVCAACHGEIAQMDQTTRATSVTTMGGCVACHKRNEVTTGCQSCHENQSSKLMR